MKPASVIPRPRSRSSFLWFSVREHDPKIAIIDRGLDDAFGKILLGRVCPASDRCQARLERAESRCCHLHERRSRFALRGSSETLISANRPIQRRRGPRFPPPCLALSRASANPPADLAQQILDPGGL